MGQNRVPFTYMTKIDRWFYTIHFLLTFFLRSLDMFTKASDTEQSPAMTEASPRQQQLNEPCADVSAESSVLFKASVKSCRIMAFGMAHVI